MRRRSQLLNRGAGLATAAAKARSSLKRNDVDQARRDIARAVRYWRRSGPRARALYLDVPGLMAWVHFYNGDGERARRSAALLMRWGRKFRKPEAVASALIRQAHLKINEGEYRTARLAAERAAVLCDWEVSSKSGYANARLLEGVAHAHLGHVTLAKERFETATQAAQEDDPTLYLAAVQSLANACVTLGDHKQARLHYRRALKLATIQTDTLRRYNAMLGLAMVTVRTGNRAQAYEHRGMLELILKEGALSQKCLAAEYMAGIMALLGEEDAAVLNMYRLGLAHARNLQSQYFAVELHRGLAEFWLDRGHHRYAALHQRRGAPLRGHCEDNLALKRIGLELEAAGPEEALSRLLAHAERAARTGYKFEQLLTYGRIAENAKFFGDEAMMETYRKRMEFLAEECDAAGLMERTDPGDLPRRQAEAGTMLAQHGILTRCPALEAQGELIMKVAPTGVPVLIRGESGTGKELFANLVHLAGTRNEERFLAVNCAAIPGELMESELFGHRKGSFTGAVDEHPGLIRMAHRGTLFLDEIGELHPSLQAKLLRVLETGEIRRVGDTRSETVDVRLVAATNADLESAIESGAFRQDLYYRLCGLEITLPPLRERRQDIPLLASFFLEQAGDRLGKDLTLPFATQQWLMSLSWPGNIRELKSALERAAALCPDGDQVTPEHFPTASKNKGSTLAEELADIERSRIEHALRATQGNVAAAARLLGLSRTTVNGKIERLGIQR